MDDLELEARLRTHLHRRFDEAHVPAELARNIRQALTTTPRRVGFDLRAGGLRFGWTAVFALAVVVVAVAIAGNLAGPIGPGDRPSATPAPSFAAERQFIVLPPDGTVLSKPEASLAGDVLSARIRALGIGNFTSGGGYGIEFRLPAAGPSDTLIRAVLSATGDVRLVPLPAEDYGPGKLTATLGDPLPKDEPALIGWDGIASVASDPLGGAPDLSITLKPAAAQAFGDYTVAHVGETFAIVVDGRVALLPTVMDAITNGQITITPAPDDSFAETAAILVGGMLPEAWRGARVPEIDPMEVAVSRALGWVPTATVESVDLEAIPDGSGWRAVWSVVLTGEFGDLGPLCSKPGPAASPCLATADSALLVLDASSGDIVSIEAPPLTLD